MGGFNLADTSVTTSLKYGLNASAKRKPAKAPARPLAAFAGADDDDDDGPSDAAGAHRRGNAEVARQQAAARDDARARALHAAALQQDASVFEYDAHHDAHRDALRAKQREADEERVDRKSRYVETLMRRRDEREREDAVLKERRLVREREREDHLYGDKERFVTSAYKKKLREDAAWLAEDKARDEADAKDAAALRKGDMSSFYRGAMARGGAGGASGCASTRARDADAEKGRRGVVRSGDDDVERAEAHETTARRAARRAEDSDAAGAANGADEIVPPRGPSAEPDFAPSASAAAPVVRRADSAKARDARARYLERKRRKESAKRGG